MARFTLTIRRLDIHDHSPSAHRAVIAAALDQVKQAVGGGTATWGEIVTPASGAQARAVTGSWEILED